MKQVLCFAQGSATPAEPMFFDLVGGCQSPQTTDSEALVPWRSSGTWRNFVVEINVPPGAGKSWAFTAQVDGADTALTVTISGSNTSGRITGTDLAFTNGSRIRLKVTPSGTPTDFSFCRWSIEWEGTTPRESTYGMNTGGVNVAQGYFPVFGATHNRTFNASTVNRANVVAAAGALTGVTVRYDATPPSAGTGWTVRIVKNGILQDGSGGTVDTTCDATTGAQTVAATFSLPLDPDDTVYYQADRVGVPGAQTVGISCSFLADTDGESQYANAGTDGTGGGAFRYHAAHGGVDGWEALGFSTRNIAGVTTFILKHLHVLLGTAPGSGKSETFEPLVNDLVPSTAQSVTISDTATTGSDTTHEHQVADGQTFTLRQAQTNSPASTVVSWSYIQVIGTTGGGGGSPTQAGTGGLIEMCFGGSYRAWYPITRHGCTDTRPAVAAGSLYAAARPPRQSGAAGAVAPR